MPRPGNTNPAASPGTCGKSSGDSATSSRRVPTVEVHVSNPARRGNISEIVRVTRCAVAGHGVFGYYLALRGVVELLKS